MSIFGRVAAVASTIALAAAAAPAAAPRDWSTVAVRAPDGAYVEGNPNARVKLIEYLSLTCPHCAKLENEGIAPLTAKYIRTGLVSYEVRHALRDGFDFTGSLLARCDGPGHFFAVLPIIFARQDVWYRQASTWAQSGAAPKGDLPPDQLFPQLAAGSGLDKIFLARGYTALKVKACLVNTADQKLLVAQANEAWQRPGFPGTPTFLINGTMVPDIASWADLDKALGAALK